MFKIIGSDGREYGPISAEQLREWIRAGRAGGQTQTQRAEAPGWIPLSSLPEFADLFRAPPTAAMPAGLPSVVRTFGILNIAVGVFVLLRQVSTLVGLMVAMPHMTNFSLFTATFIVFQSLGVLGVAARIASGIGLLRGREWARQLAVYYAAFAILLGLYGLGQTAFWMISSSSSMPWMASVSFLLNTGFNVLLLAFNIATLILLSRKAVRAALAAR